MTGRIHSIENFGTVDGPGIRVVIFLQGCNLRCVYCHNPDTWSLSEGTEMTVDQIIAKVLRFKPYFDASGGGITVSGGEPLLQMSFVTELFKRCHENGIHTCLDTNGFADPTQALDELIGYTDFVLLDIKHMDDNKHTAITGSSNVRVLSFARYLEQRQKRFRIRMVIVPELSDEMANIQALKDYFASLQYLDKIELLPFHKMGEYKWLELGLSDSLRDTQPPSEIAMEKLNVLIHRAGD